MPISLRLRRARRHANLSQTAVAAAIGVQRSAVSNWESTSNTLPSSSNLIAAAQACGVSVEWLITGRGPMQLTGDQDVPAVDAELIVDSEERALLSGFRRLSPKSQQAILTLIREIAGQRRQRSRSLA